MIQEQIGRRIRELRLERKLSQEKFSFEAGLDRTYIASVERGKRNISIVNLEKIWKALGITAGVFFSSELFNCKNESKQ